MIVEAALSAVSLSPAFAETGSASALLVGRARVASALVKFLTTTVFGGIEAD